MSSVGVKARVRFSVDQYSRDNLSVLLRSVALDSTFIQTLLSRHIIPFGLLLLQGFLEWSFVRSLVLGLVEKLNSALAQLCPTAGRMRSSSVVYVVYVLTTCLFSMILNYAFLCR